VWRRWLVRLESESSAVDGSMAELGEQGILFMGGAWFGGARWNARTLPGVHGCDGFFAVSWSELRSGILNEVNCLVGEGELDGFAFDDTMACKRRLRDDVPMALARAMGAAWGVVCGGGPSVGRACAVGWKGCLRWAREVEVFGLRCEVCCGGAGGRSAR